MSEIVNIHEAKTHLSRLLERVRRGDSITIAKAGVPVARLVPIGEPAVKRVSEPRRLPHGAVDPDRGKRLTRWLEREVWPHLVPGPPITKEERERLLGYGPDGV